MKVPPRQHLGERSHGKPLTRAALEVLLESKGIPAERYALYGSHDRDAFVMDHRRSGWVVFYSERGGEADLRVHQTEWDVCRDVLERLGL